ncbi:MAG: PD-(D/E)XK nuclease family protein [Candidatus Eremiobacteraeota bacterium]|nr:PD-(D/E)XK nuclease family protein [Candidatus Eremiobacteraeota bacterium]
MIRSRCSGVDHDVGAAYATLAARTGSLLEAIDAGRLALPSNDRDAVLRFAERMRRLAALATAMEDEPLAAAAAEIFSCHAERLQTPRAPSNGIELAEPQDREPSAPVFARQPHFSASSLNAYVECERKWFYRYACSAVEDRVSSASAYGTAFHSALEDFHGEFPHPSERDEGEMRTRIRGHVTWAFERNRAGFDTGVEFELQLRRAQRTAQRYVDWLIWESKRAPFTVVARELPAAIELEGRPFVGFIDRLDRDERTGATVVVDYKTGSIAATASEYRDKIRTFQDFQLPFYYWVRTAAGDCVSRLALIPLRDARLDVRPVVVDVDAEVIADLERARTRMIELSGDLASGRAREFAVTSNATACQYCAYAIACANKPSPPAERFGQ